MTVPKKPKIYHITHLRNLSQIAESGWLWSDAKRIEQNLDCHIVGMSKIKERRLSQIEVTCHPETKVGDYAPFYFCPRSIMLYILKMGNHPDLEYSEGQAPMLHLQVDLRQAVQWADNYGVRWAFSDRNAGSFVAEFFNHWNDLTKLNWKAIAATDFRDALIKDGKQAEFLMHDAFPWSLVERIGVVSSGTKAQATALLAENEHRPPVTVQPSWYY